MGGFMAPRAVQPQIQRLRLLLEQANQRARVAERELNAHRERQLRVIQFFNLMVNYVRDQVPYRQYYETFIQFPIVSACTAIKELFQKFQDYARRNPQKVIIGFCIILMLILLGIGYFCFAEEITAAFWMIFNKFSMMASKVYAFGVEVATVCTNGIIQIASSTKEIMIKYVEIAGNVEDYLVNLYTSILQFCRAINQPEMYEYLVYGAKILTKSYFCIKYGFQLLHQLLKRLD